MRRIGLASVVLVAAFLTMVGSASAVTPTAIVCVPQSPSQPVLSPDKEGNCLMNSKTKYKEIVIGKEGLPGKEGPAGKEGKAGPAGKEGKEGPAGKEGKEGPAGKEGKEGKSGLSGLSEEELKTLAGVLPCIKFVANGVDEKPTVQITGCNLQIVNGMGKTKTTNGEGNLVIGYDELRQELEPSTCVLGPPEPPCPTAPQTGSHNLILGTEQEFTSYGGIVAGWKNTVTGVFSSVTAGLLNTASGEETSVSGGVGNKATAEVASVSGGDQNSAETREGSISGGFGNAVKTGSGGGEAPWIGGGVDNLADAPYSSVSGGAKNHAAKYGSSIFGGKELTTAAEYEAIP